MGRNLKGQQCDGNIVWFVDFHDGVTDLVLPKSAVWQMDCTDSVKADSLSVLSEVFDDLSFREQIERYAVTGGVLKYIESFSDKRDIYTGIEEKILELSGYLYEEPYFLLQREVSKRAL